MAEENLDASALSFATPTTPTTSIFANSQANIRGGFLLCRAGLLTNSSGEFSFSH
jgi:hypothetical protein